MNDPKNETESDCIDFRKTLSIIDNHETIVYGAQSITGQKDHLPKIDTQINKSTLLGTGGIGIVYSAAQPNLERTVAIKQLRVDPLLGDYAKLLEHEAKITGRLEHPNILPVYMYGQLNGQATMVMKRLEGETWDKHLEKKPCTQSLSELIAAISIIQEVGNAVAYSHNYGIIHRDIKPENIHLGRHGEVFLLDWGLAVELGEPNIFPENALVGTPAYMPPEMANTNISQQGEETDVYLLGATLYEAIFNRSPHEGNDLQEILYNIKNTQSISIPNEIPEALQVLLRRALAFDPQNRYPSIYELLIALKNVKSTLKNLPFIRNIERQCDIIQYAINNELTDWQDSLDSMLLSYQALSEDYYARTLEQEVQKTVVMAIELEITLQRYATARHISTKLPKPEERIELLLKEVESKVLNKRENFDEWQRQNNPNTGMIQRLSASGILTIIWMSITWILYSAPHIGYKSSWGWGITLVVFGFYNKGFRVTTHNKRIAKAISLLLLCTISAALISPLLEVDDAIKMSFVQMSFGIALGVMGILSTPVFWFAAIPFWVSAFLVAAYPQYNDVWTALSKATAFGGMSLYWMVQFSRVKEHSQ